MAKQVVLQENPEITASILDDSILEGYNESIQSYNKKFRKVLRKFKKYNLELTGSSPFMLVHLANSGLLPKDTQLATRKDLETAVSKDGNFLNNQYTDFGLVLRTSEDTYESDVLPVKVLAEELLSRGIKLDEGKLIPFKILKNQEDPNSHYGAVFRLNENATKDDILDLGQLELDYSDEVLACARLNSVGDWISYWDLSDSCGYGRVVVVTGEATSKKILDRYLNRLKSKRDEAIAELKRKYVEEESLLRVK